MPATILISQHNALRRAAYLKNDKIFDVDEEWLIPEAMVRPCLDQVYWGRVIGGDRRYAFIKLPEGQMGLLPLEPHFPKLTDGQAVLVQVRREAIPDKGTPQKGVLLTRNITLGGRFCLYHPFREKRLISSKVQDPAVRQRLQALIGDQEPITLRQAAADATPAQIQEEIAGLQQQFREIEALASKALCMAPYDALTPSYRWLRDLGVGEGRAILVDHDEALYGVRVFLNAYRPDLLPLVQKHNAGSVFQAYGLEEMWDSLFQDVVVLPGGGNIVLSVTAAAVVVDVNQGTKDIQETNKQAVPVVVQHLKLRRLGGNILIDFIGIELSPQDRKCFKDLMLRAAADYDLPLQIYGWSKLGWMEARLPKQRLPLGEMVTSRV
jgi:Rne/Rng family ribonuclease